MNGNDPQRRRFLRGAAALGTLAVARAIPAWARTASEGVTAAGGALSGEIIDLTVGSTHFRAGGRSGHAVTVNGTLPGPLLRLKEGQNLKLRIRNTLAEATSIHWHGLLVPWSMDGVPGVSFPGIAAGTTFEYEFPVRQAGTYWYHSHSNMQEAMGLYGAIIIDPADTEPVAFDREHVLVLSDWSFLHPHELLKKNKQQPGYFNERRQTLSGLSQGQDLPAAERRAWSRMRMDPTDISDVTGSVYTYLVNGQDTMANWTGLYRPGERVRLRIINASAMTNFNVRIPGLAMTVIQADGQDLEPVETDELQIAIAETYDVIMSPRDAGPYGFIAEAVDRSGLCRATLATTAGIAAEVPALRERPLLTMKDMGMSMSMPGEDHAGMDHGATMPVDRTGDRPTGLEEVPHRVLTYRDLKSRAPNPDPREPSRELDVHLTGNMERYMWSFDGVGFSERPAPLAFRHGERVRVNLINDTMMSHPLHLHGHFFEVVTGNAGHHPRKHSVNVLPGGRLSFDFTASAMGDWAFHCHMLLHMHSGMFRVVTVRHEGMGS